ncbi:MAG: enoyl-CoA hydratase-related protein, partial [Acidimicrobiia bacterium]
RPDAMNALTVELGKELRDRLDEAAADSGVGCAVLTGAGQGFCAGDDMQNAWNPEVLEAEMAKLSQPIPKPTEETMHLVEFAKPLVVAVSGVAVGVGLDLALHVDIRIANKYARFGALYVNFNLGRLASAEIGGFLLGLPIAAVVADAVGLRAPFVLLAFLIGVTAPFVLLVKGPDRRRCAPERSRAGAASIAGNPCWSPARWCCISPTGCSRRHGRATSTTWAPARCSSVST